MSIAEKLTTIAGNEPKVYGAGRTAESRVWWDAITCDNTRTDMSAMFSYIDFEKIGGFTPPYQLKPAYADKMFSSSTVQKVTASDVDFSNCKSASNVFNQCHQLTEIIGVDLSKAVNISYAFNTMNNVHTIDITIGENISGTPQYAFWALPKLENLTIGGGILFSFTLQHSKLLTAKSVENVVCALSDNTTGKSATFNTTVKQTYYNAYSHEYADAETAWAALCNIKSNWTIVLNG